MTNYCLRALSLLVDFPGEEVFKQSPGTIYLPLHSLQKNGYLSVEVKREGRRSWREYSATKEGKRVLSAAKRKLRELFNELIE